MNQKSRFANLNKNIMSHVATPPDETTKGLEPPKSQSAPAKLAGIAFHQRDLEGQLEQAQKEAGAAKEIRIELIDTSPYQTREISQEKVDELAQNLVNNPLTTPVIVRKTGERYELIAGHHRVAAFKQLGRTEIPSVTRDFDDVAASDALFMDNMIEPALPDYEKYLGLVAYQKNHPESSSMKALADKTGFSKSTIQKLLSFSSLPEKSLAFIDANRKILGANAAQNLSTLIDVSDQEIHDALVLVAAGQIKQTDLVKHLSEPSSTRKKPIEKPEFIVTRGKDFYAKVLRTKKKLTINVADEETASEIEKVIQELLKNKANA